MITIEAYRARIGCFFVKHHRGTQTKKSHRSFETGCCGWNALFHIWIFLFILTLSIKINMAFLEVSLLLLGGDIESNPGPPVTGKIQKVVLGTLHQGHAKFGDIAGIQCSCNVLYAICFSIVKKFLFGSRFIKAMPNLVTLLAYNAHVMRSMQYVSP